MVVTACDRAHSCEVHHGFGSCLPDSPLDSRAIRNLELPRPVWAAAGLDEVSTRAEALALAKAVRGAR